MAGLDGCGRLGVVFGGAAQLSRNQAAPHGFYSPEEHLYQLRGKLYRDLRVRIDTGIHLGLMQFEDAVTLFSETVDFMPGSCTDAKSLRNPDKRASCDSARRAVTRYSRWPTQAITYRLGKDQILACASVCRRSWVSSSPPSSFTWSS